MVSAWKIAAIALMFACSAAGFAQGSAKPRVDFVYFGAGDCPYCRGWEANDLPKLKASPVFQKVRFTKVTKLIKSPVPSAMWFPEEIKHLREPIADSLKGVGSPMFAVLADGKVVAAWKGTRKGPQEVLAILEKEFSGSASAGPAAGAVNPAR